MSARAWHKIWNMKGGGINPSVLHEDKILSINGFDSKTGSLTNDDINDKVEYILSKSKLQKGDKVLEIGCGTGLFYGSIREKMPINYTGIDYSKSMIEIAKYFYNDANFYESDAKSYLYKSDEYDLIFIHSALQYMGNVQYVSALIKKLFCSLKAKGNLMLLDVYNKQSKEQDISARIKSFGNTEEYYRRYKDLEHLYLTESELKGIVSDAGFEEIITTPVKINSKARDCPEFRFNLICSKCH